MVFSVFNISRLEFSINLHNFSKYLESCLSTVKYFRRKIALDMCVYVGCPPFPWRDKIPTERLHLHRYWPVEMAHCTQV